MFRDFSEAAKEKILGYIDEATPKGKWDEIVDAIQDFGSTVWDWLTQLDAAGSINDLDAYHRHVIDKHDTSVESINEIFADANTADAHYAASMTEAAEQGKQMVKFINDLADTIDPNGGRFTDEYMNGVLAADTEAIAEGKTVMDSVIEQEMLGAAAIAAKYEGDPVNMSTGNFIYDREDLAIKGEIPLSLFCRTEAA